MLVHRKKKGAEKVENATKDSFLGLAAMDIDKYSYTDGNNRLLLLFMSNL